MLPQGSREPVSARGRLRLAVLVGLSLHGQELVVCVVGFPQSNECWPPAPAVPLILGPAAPLVGHSAGSWYRHAQPLRFPRGHMLISRKPQQPPEPSASR